MAIKKTEIASRAFALADALPLTTLAGGPLPVGVADVAALALVPWFCDASVQWAFRISDPAAPLKKSWLGRMANTFVSIDEGRVLIGVPGDGIEPSTYTLQPLAEAVASAATPGMTLELATANLGMVKRDWEVRAESHTSDGNQCYAGTVAAHGVWNIERTAPAVTPAQLDTAIDCGRKAVALGPWDVKDVDEAEAILRLWLWSPQANINPMAVKRLWTLRDLRFENAGSDEERRRMGGLDRKLSGLALGYFRHRLAGGPFRWSEARSPMNTEEQVEDVVRTVVRANG